MKEHFGEKISFGFSSSKDGPMNIVGHEFYDAERRANRAAFFSRVGVKATECVYPKPLHTGRAEVVDVYNPVYGSISCDAIITGKKGLALTMTAGDCPPVALYDPVNQVIALIHAGWRPLVAGIISHTIEKMRVEMNCFPGNLKAFIGVGICRECYEVKGDVASKFGFEIPSYGKMYLSLSDEVDKRLQLEGVSKMNILASSECTCHTDDGAKYFSWRRDKSDPLECQMAVLVMR